LGYVRLLRRGPVLALWGAQTLSVFGDRLYAMAIMWIAWQQSGAGAMGLVAIAESVPYIVLGTVGRRLMDRFATLKRVGLVAALPWAWERYGTPGMLTLAAALGAAGAVFDPNLGALVPGLVRPEEVQAVNGLMDLTGRIARVAGPGSAGILLAMIPGQSLFWLDAVTFAVSAAALAHLARHARAATPTGAPQPPDSAPRARILLRTHKATAVAIGVHGAAIFAQAVTFALPALLAGQLHAGAAAYGLVLAATGTGALAGNAVAGNWKLPEPLPVVYCAAWALSGLLLAATGSAASLPVLLVLSAASGVVAPFMGVALSTHLSGFPPASRRRLMSVDLTVIRSAGTTSMLVIPAVAAGSPTVGFLAGGMFTFVLAVAGGVTAWRWTSSTVPVPAMEPARELARD
jgi:hypothetical protein